MLVWAARGAIAPGSAGLCVMWAVQFVISLNFNTINLTEAESKLTSVERVKEYVNHGYIDEPTLYRTLVISLLL